MVAAVITGFKTLTQYPPALLLMPAVLWVFALVIYLRRYALGEARRKLGSL